MSTTETYVEIYTNLGFLFYSIAAGDGQVRQAEVDALNELVKKLLFMTQYRMLCHIQFS